MEASIKLPRANVKDQNPTPRNVKLTLSVAISVWTAPLSQERIPPQVLSHVIRFTQYIDICIFFTLQTEPGRSGLDQRGIYALPIKIQFSLFVEQLKHVHFNYIKISNFYQWI